MKQKKGKFLLTHGRINTLFAIFVCLLFIAHRFFRDEFCFCGMVIGINLLWRKRSLSKDSCRLFPRMRFRCGQILFGLAAGLLGSFFMSRTLQALLVQVKPYDPATFLTVLFLLIAVAFIACYSPANRATKADPISVLRAE